MARPNKKPKVLVSWIGRADLNASEIADEVNVGPVAQALTQRQFDRAVLLSNYPARETKRYVAWLESKTEIPVELQLVELSSPTNLGEIYEAVDARIRAMRESLGDDVRLTFHVSPGTPAMAAIWIIMAKTRHAAELIESSLEHGVKTASVPFDISAEFIPELFSGPDRVIGALAQGEADEAPAFAQIVHRSAAMKRVIDRAKMAAPRDVSILIEGESGTGKEMLARAIHNASPRRTGPFIAVNCGAISRELAESELFGHRKGAFTGAYADRTGYVEDAGGGTLFLDEIGEMSADLQVKFLRVLQDHVVTPVGATKGVQVNVRVIAATNRTLAAEVASGRFREDLFFRLAVGVLRLPPIRERSGDVGLLIDALLERVNADCAADPAWQHKKLSAGARNFLLQQSWPGNVRELANTLTRAAVWSGEATVSKEDVEDAVLAPGFLRPVGNDVLGRPLDQGIDLDGLLRAVEQHYIERALREANNNKTRAAHLLGLGSYQTLTNRLKRLGME